MSGAILERANLSDSAEAAIRLMIFGGDLAAGERINEVHLAERLGVSRTPLREALNRLTAEGAVEARPRLGYFVRPLTLEDFVQVYDIRPILDPAALRLAGLRSAEQIERLDKLNRKLSKTRDPMFAIALDDEWHFTLLEGCPNRVLIELIRSFIARTRRYELALMRDVSGVARASNDHEAILEALRARDLDAACAALKDNMQSGKAPIVAWLKEREAAASRTGKRT
jgi:DNA-binding GntR family transcriptional regulator